MYSTYSVGCPWYTQHDLEPMTYNQINHVDVRINPARCHKGNTLSIIKSLNFHMTPCHGYCSWICTNRCFRGWFNITRWSNVKGQGPANHMPAKPLLATLTNGVSAMPTSPVREFRKRVGPLIVLLGKYVSTDHNLGTSHFHGEPTATLVELEWFFSCRKDASH